MDDKTITRLSESIAELFAVQGESCMDILDEILDGIYHQGDIYAKEALYTLPFLLRFLVKANIEEKSYILGIVGLLMETCQTAISASHKDSHLLKTLYHMLCEALPTYVALLTHNDRQIRMLAAFIAGYCTENTFDLVICLKARYDEEQDEYVQFALIKSLTLLHGYTRGELDRLFAGTTSKILRHVLSLAIVEICGDEVASIVEMTLIEDLLDIEHIESAYMLAPYNLSSAPAIFHALSFLSQRRSVRLLIEAVNRWHYEGRQTLLSLLDMIEQLFKFAAFSNPVRLKTFQWKDDATCKIRYYASHNVNEYQITLESLSQEQYQALCCLFNCECFWKQDTNFLEAYSLPITKQALAEMIHID